MMEYATTQFIDKKNNIKILPVPVAPWDGALGVGQDDHKRRHYYQDHS